MKDWENLVLRTIKNMSFSVNGFRTMDCGVSGEVLNKLSRNLAGSHDLSSWWVIGEGWKTLRCKSFIAAVGKLSKTCTRRTSISLTLFLSHSLSLSLSLPNPHPVRRIRNSIALRPRPSDCSPWCHYFRVPPVLRCTVMIDDWDLRKLRWLLFDSKIKFVITGSPAEFLDVRILMSDSSKDDGRSLIVLVEVEAERAWLTHRSMGRQCSTQVGCGSSRHSLKITERRLDGTTSFQSSLGSSIFPFRKVLL